MLQITSHFGLADSAFARIYCRPLAQLSQLDFD